MRNFSRPYGLLFLSFSILIMISGADAQDSNSSQEKDILVELDNATWISDIEWNPENSSQIEVIVQSKIPKPISIQEIPDYQGRSGSFSPMKQVTLSPGKNIVSVSVNGKDDLGIAITDRNDGAYYQKGANPLISNITRMDFYLFGLLASISVIVQIFSRQKIGDLILSNKPGEIG